MRPITGTILGTILLTVLAAPRADSAAVNSTFEEQVPIELNVYLPCTGEIVAMSGRLHVLIQTTINDNRLTVKSQFQPMNVSGAGTVSGDSYKATGLTQSTETFSVVGFPYTYTSVNRFHIVGTATAASFYVKDTSHVTVNANGEVTSLVSNIDVICE